MSDFDFSDEELADIYRGMPTELLKRAARGYYVDEVIAHVLGPEIEAVCRRRLAAIEAELERRGITFDPGGKLF